MAGKTLIGGTAYTVKGGKVKVNGTNYSIKGGKTLINGTAKSIAFTSIPESYQEVSYLQSSGTQYITVGTKTVAGIDIYCYNVKRINSNDNPFIGGEVGSSSWSVQWVPSSGIRYQAKDTWSSFYAVSDIPHLVHLSSLAARSALEIDGVEKLIQYIGILTNAPIRLFARKASERWAGQMGEVIVMSSGTLLNHLKPCYRKSDNVAGYYDIVNNVFKTNEGTGSFVAGPVV